MAKLLKWGCGLVVALGSVVAILLLVSSDLREIVTVIGVMMLAMVAGGMAEHSIPSNFSEAEAEVVSVTLADERQVFNIGTITLKYVDERGTAHRKLARPYSNRPKVASLRSGDTLRIGVCNKDPTIIKIPFIRVNDDSKCDLLSNAAPSSKDANP